MTKVLFVCTGNTCRSPLAEAIFEQKKTSNNFQAKSAGVHAIDGMVMSEGSKSVLAKRGLKQSHKSRSVTRDLLDWADIILTMTTNHKRVLIEQFPDYANNVFTLKEYVYDDPEILDKLEKMKHHMAQLELKRASILSENQDKVEEYNKTKELEDQKSLEKKLLEELQPDHEAIERIASQLPSFDIADPYGADEATYEKTYKEMEAAVEKLLNKLNKKSS